MRYQPYEDKYFIPEIVQVFIDQHEAPLTEDTTTDEEIESHGESN